MKRLAVLLLIFAAVACKKEGTTPDPVGSITVSPNPAGVGINDTTRLFAVVRDPSGNVVDRTVRWRSLNPNIATVSGDGVVRGVSAGTAQIEASVGGTTTTVTVRVTAGSYRTFNVNADQACESPAYKSALLVATTARVAIYEDITNPGGGPTPAQYQQVANTVESLVYDVNVANFGAPTDIDANGRIIILYTRAVNELTPRNAGFVVAGFMYARDLFPRSATADLGACRGSNVAEMFYMLAADPTGLVNGNVRPLDYVLNSTVGTVAHEFQHVINSGRRLRILRTSNWDETVWLDEGLSHIAEELTFYAASGRGPRQNLNQSDVFTPGPVAAAFESYGRSNLDRFDSYLSNPSAHGPFADNDDLATRGAIWSFLRYSADRRGGNDAQLWSGLVNSTLKGLSNLQSALGTDPMIWARDWSVANYTDDAVAGIASIYTHPSWNYRSVLSAGRWGGYPLPVTPLVAGATANATIRAGSAAYFRFALPPATTADVRVALGGTTLAGACTAVTLAPGGVFHATSANAALCVTGGATVGEYVLIPFYGARDATGESANGSTAVSVVATGVIPPTPPPSPSVDFTEERVRPRHPGDGGFEGRLRARERSELRRLVMRGRASDRVTADPPAAGVHISLVRIR